MRLLLSNLAGRGLVTSANGAVRPGAGVPDATGVPGGPAIGGDGHVNLTDEGEAAAARLVTARRDALSDLVQDWDPEHHAELAAMLLPAWPGTWPKDRRRFRSRRNGPRPDNRDAPEVGWGLWFVGLKKLLDEGA